MNTSWCLDFSSSGSTGIKGEQLLPILLEAGKIHFQEVTKTVTKTFRRNKKKAKLQEAKIECILKPSSELLNHPGSKHAFKITTTFGETVPNLYFKFCEQSPLHTEEEWEQVTYPKLLKHKQFAEQYHKFIEYVRSRSLEQLEGFTT